MFELPDVVAGCVGELLDEFDDGSEALGGGLDLWAKDPDAIFVIVLGEVDEDGLSHDGSVDGGARGDVLGERSGR